VNNNRLNLIDVVVNGDVHSPTGSEIQVAGSVTFNGLVSGGANFPGAGLVIFNGGYDPGDSPAEVTFNGDLNFGPANTLTMELGGTTGGDEYDRLDVLGTLSLDGTMNVTLIDGFVPANGDTFDLLDWGSLDGTFDTVNLPSLAPGLAWDDSALYTTGELHVTPEPGTLALAAIGAMTILRRRRRSASDPRQARTAPSRW